MITAQEFAEARSRTLDYLARAGIVLTLEEEAVIEVADFGCDLGEPVCGGKSDDRRVGEVAVCAAAAVTGLPVAGDTGPVAVEVRRRFNA